MSKEALKGAVAGSVWIAFEGTLSYTPVSGPIRWPDAGAPLIKINDDGGVSGTYVDLKEHLEAQSAALLGVATSFDDPAHKTAPSEGQIYIRSDAEGGARAL